jgi:hypothetical protein
MAAAGSSSKPESRTQSQFSKSNRICSAEWHCRNAQEGANHENMAKPPENGHQIDRLQIDLAENCSGDS